MKIFISHSWKDKTIAQQVADSFAGVADVWLDLNNLFPGQNIEDAIDAAIEQMDFVFVLWSANSAVSDGVQQEISSTRRAGVGIIPCLLDKTPLDSNPDLRGLLGIDFTDQRVGLLRLQIFAVQKLANSTGGADIAALNDLKGYEGVLNYINDYRNNQETSGGDGAYWIEKMMKNTNQSFASLSQAKARVDDLLELMKFSIAEIEEAGDDKERLQTLLNELNYHQYRDADQIKMVREFIEGKLRSL